MQMEHMAYEEACSVDWACMSNSLYFPTPPRLDAPLFLPWVLSLAVAQRAILTPLS